MKYAIFAIVALAVAVFAMVSGGEGYVTVTQAQEPPPPPQSLTAINGLNLGTAILTWTTVPGVSSYRVGWLAKEDYLAYIDNEIWRQKFAYSDVIASSTYTVARLTLGADYYLIVGRKHDGGIAWSEWQELTLNADVASCPVAEPPMATSGDYDADNDGLIEVSNLAQLNAMRWDSDGDGTISGSDDKAKHSNAFPGAIADMGCPDSGCTGYELITDLDFDNNGNGAADAGDAYWNDGAGWEPMELGSTFDGGGHTLANLYINRANQDAVGLFGSPFQGRIQGVGLISADVTGRNEVGGLVGDGHGLHITDSYVTGTVSGEDGIGGLIGDSFQGTITASYAAADVSGSGSVGGLIGDSHTDAISNSYATGTVVGTEDEVGGLAGDSFSATITASYASGNVSGGGSVGGLLGDSSSDTISASYATGSVTGSGDDVGGLVGNNFSATITASYASGNVSGGGSVGGLLGDSSSDTISASYATGSVTGSGDDVGGLVGNNFNATITASYWDTQTTGQSSSDGGDGKTTAELQSPTGYTGIFATWDMNLDADGSNDDPWDFGTSTQYPVLKYGTLTAAGQRP